MNNTSETIVFFGSGPVAAKSLRLLCNNFSVEAVITKPRAAHHHGDVPVLEAAEELHLPVYTAADKAALDSLLAHHTFASRLAILIDFGIIVSQAVIDSFPLGIINSHFSLLPQWRGADPITFAILSGQRKTGVSLMLLTAGMDEGPLLAQQSYQLTAESTTPQLTDALISLSDQLLVQTVPRYCAGGAVPYPQNPALEPTYSRRLTKNDGAIDWRKPAEQLEREVRAFAGWPGSYTVLGGKSVTITKASIVHAPQSISGRVDIQGNSLVIGTAHDALRIERLKPAGKQEMSAGAFLAGYRHLLAE